ncbi:MAG TPA: disulfide bond formation protein B [Gaiellaceae bacterium]|nr:disulfide bond formation protein B [Gaiellaceae bacterium]
MTHDIIVLLAALGVAGQALAALLLLVGIAAVVGVGTPLLALQRVVEGYELWLAFLVSAIATGGSLFFSETAGFVPCELCWYQRICMYPLAIVTLLAAAFDDRRAARYLLPLPVVGAGVSVYHLLVENRVVGESQICKFSGGCATKWIDEFGYMTIPTLALTGFALVFAFLLLAALDGGPADATATVVEA